MHREERGRGRPDRGAREISRPGSRLLRLADGRIKKGKYANVLRRRTARGVSKETLLNKDDGKKRRCGLGNEEERGASRAAEERYKGAEQSHKRGEGGRGDNESFGRGETGGALGFVTTSETRRVPRSRGGESGSIIPATAKMPGAREGSGVLWRYAGTKKDGAGADYYCVGNAEGVECEEEDWLRLRTSGGEARSLDRGGGKGAAVADSGPGSPWRTRGGRTVSRAREITGWRQGAGGLGRCHHRRCDSRCGRGGAWAWAWRRRQLDRGLGGVTPWPPVACNARNHCAAECRILAAVAFAIMGRRVVSTTSHVTTQLATKAPRLAIRIADSTCCQLQPHGASADSPQRAHPEPPRASTHTQGLQRGAFVSGVSGRSPSGMCGAGPLVGWRRKPQVRQRGFRRQGPDTRRGCSRPILRWALLACTMALRLWLREWWYHGYFEVTSPGFLRRRVCEDSASSSGAPAHHYLDVLPLPSYPWSDAPHGTHPFHTPSPPRTTTPEIHKTTTDRVLDHPKQPRRDNRPETKAETRHALPADKTRSPSHPTPMSPIKGEARDTDVDPGRSRL